MTRSITKAPSAPSAARPPRRLRLIVATSLLTLAAGFVQLAAAEGPGHGGHGGMGMGMGMGPMGGHRGGPGMGGMGMGGFGGPMGERVLDSVNASAEQKAQIRSIMDAARRDLQGQRESGRVLREQAAKLFTQPNVDARQAEALRQQMLAQHDAASKRMLQAMLDASRVLTPEQRQQLGERVAQRRAMMERHRAERQSLDGGPGGARRP